MRVHCDIGYPENRFVVIPNGYNCASYAPDSSARRRIRAELGIGQGSIVIGQVARWDAQKDHANLLASLAILVRSGVEYRCLLVGDGMTDENAALRSLISSHHLEDKILLMGLRKDIPAIMNALDLHILSSAYGEAFPNVVAESMACGTPCVVTRVGDAEFIVGTTGWVVPPRDAPALADAITQALKELHSGTWNHRQEECRRRITRNFSIDRMISSYLEVWRSVARKGK
jgi:glycosyltransferase involved in cell wall biosynthesis